MGKEFIVIYLIVDKDVYYFNIVNVKVCIGGVKFSESYLNILVIISVVELFEVDVIFFGYGFLSEN